MKRIAIVSLLTLLGLSAAALAQPLPVCSLCVGNVINVDQAPQSAVPMLLELKGDQLSGASTMLASVRPELRRQMVVTVTFDAAAAGDPLLEAESQSKRLVEWAQASGPFDGLGIAVAAEPRIAAYALKRLSVTAQGLSIAGRIVLPRGVALAPMFEEGAQAYFDAVVVDAPQTAETLAWLAERDPSKKVFAVAAITSPNAMFDLARPLSAGAIRAYAATPIDPASAASVNRTFTGDWAFDSTAKTAVLDARGQETAMETLTFVRGEDLRTIVVPFGDASASSIVALPTDRYMKPHQIDAKGDRPITDTGSRGGRLLIGIPPVKAPFLISAEHAEKPNVNVTKESMDVATQRGITVEEIIRNHQAYDAYQESIQPRYIARNTTNLRFDVAAGEAIEATIAGDYFSDRDHRADWVWQDFYINGVKWKYGEIPELPLIQPEKVTQLPLDIHLTNEYRYELVRETQLFGYRTYEVRFEPPPNAPLELPLYRGTVWIDSRTWARVRLSMIQLNLKGEVLSNEERVDFVPFSRTTKAQLSETSVAATDPNEIIWLPLGVTAQQVISAAGRANIVQRATTFENFRIDPPEFETLLAQASASDARMVRETQAGLRYLEKKDGERVVKEGFDTSRLFMLGGIHHDPGLEYPVVPLGGVNYFNFNLWNRGIQTNVFFAGVILAVNATQPSFAGTRTNVGFDFFGIAIPVENTMYRNFEEMPDETVKARPIGLTLRAGHPIFEFGKVDVSLGLAHLSYSRADDTGADFEPPSNTFLITPGINAQYSRRGYNVSAFYERSTRTSWEPWGVLSEYDEDQKTFAKFGGSVGKTFFLPKFQRIGIDVSFLDGQYLDRFSKWELGFFGAQRVHGFQSGAVRAEKATIGHLTYGFVFSEQFRIEAFYDHAILDDELAGYRREPFQGVGIGGQTIGPWGTLLRLDIGKSIGRNAQDGFVANIVFLKLF
ncbi:MAG: hypothetical protein WA208_00720 [Thermoanaerobaculia bacterium]